MRQFDLVIMIDWSASSTVGPVKPGPDRCWLAWGLARRRERPAAEYFRTRGACVRRVVALLAEHEGSALVGFDFPIGYPRDEAGAAVLPEGRALIEHVSAAIVDTPDARNNRFVVAAAFNTEIRRRTGRACGPFWGVPAGQVAADITVTKTRDTGVAEYRPIERMLRGRGHNIQSAWKLLGVGSVGSQALLGLPAVGQVLRAAGARGRLWPSEPIDREDAVVVAEIWPTLGDFNNHSRYGGIGIKDERQVLAMRDAALDDPAYVRSELASAPGGESTGWIFGASRFVGG